MQRNNGDMIILSSTYVILKAQPWQRISNIYIYLYVSYQTMYTGSKVLYL